MGQTSLNMATFHFEKSPEPSRLSGVWQMAFNFQLDVPFFFFLSRLLQGNNACLFRVPNSDKFYPSVSHLAPMQKEQRRGFDVPH